MTELQTIALPPDVEYGLDTMLEHADIDAMTHTAVKLYAPRRMLMDIMDGAEKWGDGDTVETVVSARRRRVAALELAADEILAGLSRADRGAIAWAGIGHLHYEAHSLAEVCAWWAIEDEVCGGCLKPFKQTAMTKWNRRYEPNPRMARKLHAPKWIRRYVKLNSDASNLRRRASRVLARVQDIPRLEVAYGAERLRKHLLAQHEGFRVTNSRMLAHFGRACAGHHEPRRQRRKTRAVIKRAAATAIELIGQDAVREFSSGRAVRLKGRTIDLEVGRMGSSAQAGHAAVACCLVDPDSGRHLANICVYHPETPALDQLVAMALAMQAGEEAEIVTTGNLSQVSSLGLQHPLIGERGKEAMARAREPRDDPMTRNRHRYWQETKPIWLENIGVFALGRYWMGAPHEDEFTGEANFA